MFRGRAVANELDEFSKDGEFEFEFDGVDDSFQRRFDEVQIREFDGEQCDVHANDNCVDSNELVHDFPTLGAMFDAALYCRNACEIILYTVRELDESQRFFDVYDGQYAFLDEEAHHLNLLHDIIPVDEAQEGAIGERVAVGAKCKDRGGSVEDDRIGDYHVESVAKDAAGVG